MGLTKVVHVQATRRSCSLATSLLNPTISYTMYVAHGPKPKSPDGVLSWEEVKSGQWKIRTLCFWEALEIFKVHFKVGSKYDRRNFLREWTQLLHKTNKDAYDRDLD